MIIDSASYFTGDIKIVFGNDATDATAILEQYEWVEKKVLRQLLGDDLYLTFIANISQSSGKYKDLLDGVASYELADGTNAIFDGITEMLPFFIYFYYRRDEQTTRTGQGDFSDQAENSERPDKSDTRALSIKAYNRGMKFYIETDKYITRQNEVESDYYPNYSHTELGYLDIFEIY